MQIKISTIIAELKYINSVILFKINLGRLSILNIGIAAFDKLYSNEKKSFQNISSRQLMHKMCISQIRFIYS